MKKTKKMDIDPHRYTAGLSFGSLERAGKGFAKDEKEPKAISI